MSSSNFYEAISQTSDFIITISFDLPKQTTAQAWMKQLIFKWFVIEQP